MDEFGQYLVEHEVLSQDFLDDLPVADYSTADPLYNRIVKQYPEKERAVWSALADYLHLELLDPQHMQPDASLVQLLPVNLAHKYTIAPLEKQGSRLDIALADPRQFERCDELAMILSGRSDNGYSVGDNLTVQGYLACPSHIAELIKRLYGIGAASVHEIITQQDRADVRLSGSQAVDLTGDADGSGEDAAIIRFVNQLLLEAVKIGASDIHLEPFEQELRVRYRIDGFLHSEPVPANIKHLEPAIISRVKIMAQLDIAEKRLPQDGQIRLTVMGRSIDVRVSILPTLFGQGLALRILDRQVTFRRLDRLGLSSDYLDLFRAALELPHGMALVTGPTGSGKTTTLYAALNEINLPNRKIITVEDPIEYQLDGITQIQVNPTIDLNFANLLRNILRHDPDILMIGEIRDMQTARIAVSAALTGHLVFSTLHTNDAPSAPVRLLEMGIEPYLVSSALSVVLAQRLVRLLCLHCRRQMDPASQNGFAATGGNPGMPGSFEAVGCRSCRQSGYVGRTGVFEIFVLDETLRQMIRERSSGSDIRNQVRRRGMRSLYENGLALVQNGKTSLSEVIRVARDQSVHLSPEYTQSPTEED